MQRVMSVFPQVGEIEEQLMSARRELARSEEANQKLQRDVKEVRPIHQSLDLTEDRKGDGMSELAVFPWLPV